MNVIEIANSYSLDTGVTQTDALTGLYTHGLFQVFLDHALERFTRDGKRFSLIVANVDWFSFLNRRRGFIQGDQILKQIAQIIKTCIRKQDVASRFNGDQYTILLFDVNEEDGWQVAERIRSSVEDAYDDQVTMSIGIANCPQHGSSREILMHNALDAMQVAKLGGKNKVQAYNPKPIQLDYPKPRVLIVDDSILNIKIIEAMFKPYDFQILRANNGMEAIHLAEKSEVDLVLLDVMMPEMDGFEVCRRLKNKHSTRMIPVILITALDDVDSKIRGIEFGADDFITKPPNKQELLTRAKSLVKMKKLYNDFTSIESVLFSLAKAVEAKNPYTEGHSVRVAKLAVRLGMHLHLETEMVEALHFGGILHDAGKIGISNQILNKKNELSPDEAVQIKLHPITGYQICYPLKNRLKHAMHIIRYHHEKLDGSGYPDGLRGDEIPLVSRIAAVADMFDAMTFNRPYRRAMPKQEAIKILYAEVQKGKLDKDVVDLLANSIAFDWNDHDSNLSDSKNLDDIEANICLRTDQISGEWT